MNMSVFESENHSITPESGAVFPGVSKFFLPVSSEFNRPANATPYAANQTVANATSGATVLSLDIARIVGGTGWINKLRFETNAAADTSQYRVHFFHTAPTALQDGAAFTLLWANRAKRICAIDLDPMTTCGTGSDSARSQYTTPFFFHCASGDTKIYYIIETLTARTPVSGQSFYLEVTGELN